VLRLMAAVIHSLWEKGDKNPLIFAQYIYLPRLKDPAVLLQAIESGVGLLTWMQDSYAYTESCDEAAARYRVLRAGQHIVVREDDKGLLVKPDVAKRQMDAEAAAVAEATANAARSPSLPPITGSAAVTMDPMVVSATGTGTSSARSKAPNPPKAGPRRYHGAAALDPQRVGRDAGRIADEVLTHLVGLVGANVWVTLEIEVDIPGGAPDNVVRIVTENGRTLKFQDSAFERE
jgi:hypothetical protein